MTISNKAILKAYSKGYRATECGKIISPKGLERKLRVTRDGYRSFTISINGGSIGITVHRFIAFHKYGTRIFSKNIHVRHLDNDPSNNSFDNIEIGSASDNMMDKPKEVRLSSAIFASSHIKKHNHEEIIRYHNLVKSYKKVMNRFGIKSKGTLSFILKKSIAQGQILD